MTALVVVETLLLVLLSVLVAGLLRSHAEILRRLGQSGSTMNAPEPLAPGVVRDRAGATEAFDLAGTDLRGEPLKVAVTGARTGTLLAFLTSGCLTCKGFWDAFQPGVRPPMPGGARLVVVTKDTTHESPTKLRALAPRDVTVVMSSDAWEAYGVPMSPYFIYVDGPSGKVHGEGSATGWQQVMSLLTDALADGASGEPIPSLRDGNGQRDRLSRIDRDLEVAGIGPDHPSLYAADPEED